MSTSNQRLLMVDDDASNLLTLSALLEVEGYDVETVASLNGALAAVGRDPSYDLVLLDRNLRDGDGLSIVATLRRGLPRARIVLMTGDDLPADVRAVDAVIIKGEAFPVVLDRLRALAPVPAEDA
jgi:two-component system response regulator RegA